MADSPSPIPTRAPSASAGGVMMPLLFVMASAACILRVCGVAWLEMVVFAAYILAFILAPGWLLYRVINKNTTSLSRQLAVGWAMGYALEVLAFVLASHVSYRAVFFLYPVLVGGICVPILAKRRSAPFKDLIEDIKRIEPKTAWGLAITCLLSFLFVGVRYFAETPLPSAIERSALYSPDLVWSLGIAAEAKHHWPMLDPYVVGETLTYYKAVFLHLGVASQVTGLELPLLLFRLYPIPIYMLIVLQLYVLGCEIGKTRWAGLLAIALSLLSAEIVLIGFHLKPFTNDFIFYLYHSQTFLFGLIFFLALLLELFKRLEEPALHLSQWAQWAMIVLLLWAAGGSKGTTLPVILGGLALLILWKLAGERTASRSLLFAFFLTVAVYLIYQKLTYSNIVTRLQWGIFTYKDTMPVIQSLSRLTPSSLQDGWGAGFYQVLLAIFGFLGLLGLRAIGLWELYRQSVVSGFRLSAMQRWCICIALSATFAFLVFDLHSHGEKYFFYYGYPVICALSAAGLIGLWNRIRALPHKAMRQIKLAALVLLGVLSVIGPARPLKSYGVRWLLKRPTYNQTREVTPALMNGLIWAREHTPTDAVFVANNLYTEHPYADRKTIPHYFYYPAFAERRFFMASWSYTTRNLVTGFQRVRRGEVHPFPKRFALHKRLFEQGDMRALEIMQRDYKVDFLLLDKLHGPVHPGLVSNLAPIARQVYSNRDVAIYQLSP